VRVGNSFPGTPLLDCQHGQVEILGAPLPQGAAGTSLNHLAGGLAAGARQRFPCVAAAALCAHVSEYEAGAAQRLGCVASAPVGVDSSLMLVNSFAGWLQLRRANM